VLGKVRDFRYIFGTVRGKTEHEEIAMAKKTSTALLKRGQCVVLQNGELQEILVIERASRRQGAPSYAGTMLSTGDEAILLCLKNKNGPFHLKRQGGEVLHFRTMTRRPRHVFYQHIVAQQMSLNDKAESARDLAEQFRRNSTEFRKVLDATE